MYKLADGKFGEKLTSLAEAKGFKILAYYSTGTFQLETRTKPVRNLSDFKAMKVRIVPNAATTAGVQALGAVPVPIALNQVYTSLQQGTVEGATNDVLTVTSQHFYEVEKYMTVMDILCEPRPVITSKAFFDSLDKDHQDVLLSTCKASAIFERKNFEDQLKAGTDTLTKNGIQIVQLEDRPKWVDAVRPVWRQFANQDPDSAGDPEDPHENQAEAHGGRYHQHDQDKVLDAADDHLRDLIEQVLFTAPGERGMRPDFGSGLLGLVFELGGPELVATTQHLVQGSLQQELGNLIAVDSVQVSQDDGVLSVEVRYVVLRTQERAAASFARSIP